MASGRNTEGYEYDELVSAGPSRVSMTTKINKDAIREAYEDVRSDNSGTEWAVFKFDDQTITLAAKGSDFQKFKEHFKDDERVFGYIRVQATDELTKRQKFLFITWVGPSVSVIKRARMSTDKFLIKSVIRNFSAEVKLESASDIDMNYFKEVLK